MSVLLFLLYIGIAVVVGVLINKYFVSKFEKDMKKVVYVITFIVCGVVAIGEFTVSSIKTGVFKLIDEKAVELEHIIIEQNPDNELVQNGFDISFINESVQELKQLIPASIFSDEELLSGIVNKAYTKMIEIAFERLESNTGLINKYAVNGIITLQSVLHALKNDIFSYLNWWYFRLSLYILAVLALYVGYCFYTATEGKKQYKSSILFGEGAEGVERGMSGKEV
jgi:hypothetical protein